MSMIRAAAVFAVAATIVAGGPAIASEPDCYDAEVSARITRQTPTDYADCGPDCIIMAWPWIIDLNVTRVYSGDLRRGPMTAFGGAVHVFQSSQKRTPVAFAAKYTRQLQYRATRRRRTSCTLSG